MHKYLYLIVISLFIVGCSNQKNLSNTFSDNVISIEINALYDTNENITLNIYNKGPSTVSYGSPYTIEVFRDGQWVELPFIEDLAWLSNSVLLPPNENHNSSISFKHLDADIIQGQRYRVIKTFSKEDRQRKITLAAEFIVSDDN